jgi:hypothetical protein
MADVCRKVNKWIHIYICGRHHSVFRGYKKDKHKAELYDPSDILIGREAGDEGELSFTLALSLGETSWTAFHGSVADDEVGARFGIGFLRPAIGGGLLLDEVDISMALAHAKYPFCFSKQGAIACKSALSSAEGMTRH